MFVHYQVLNIFRTCCKSGKAWRSTREKEETSKTYVWYVAVVTWPCIRKLTPNDKNCLRMHSCPVWHQNVSLSSWERQYVGNALGARSPRLTASVKGNGAAREIIRPQFMSRILAVSNSTSTVCLYWSKAFLFALRMRITLSVNDTEGSAVCLPTPCSLPPTLTRESIIYVVTARDLEQWAFCSALPS